MRQAALTGPRTFTVVERPMPSIADEDVLVQVHYCGVCMGEVATWANRLDRYPLYIGHEIAGVIVDKGNAVREFDVGQRVMAVTMGNGYADYVRAHRSELVAVPAGLSLRNALGEPLACAVNAAGRANIRLGDTVVIIGAGFMGLLMLQLARVSGAAQVLMVDVRRELATVAKALGASDLIPPEEAVRRVAETTQDALADVVVEATGKEAPLQLAGDLVRTRGTVVIYGYHQEGQRTVNIGQWNWKGIDVVNGHERDTARYVEGMRRGMALAMHGRVQLSPLVTHEFSGEDINAAFSMAEEKPFGFIKAVTAWTRP